MHPKVMNPKVIFICKWCGFSHLVYHYTSYSSMFLSEVRSTRSGIFKDDTRPVTNIHKVLIGIFTTMIYTECTICSNKKKIGRKTTYTYRR